MLVLHHLRFPSASHPLSDSPANAVHDYALGCALNCIQKYSTLLRFCFWFHFGSHPRQALPTGFVAAVLGVGRAHRGSGDGPKWLARLV